MLPSKEKLDKYVEMGLLDKQVHPTFPITIYHYSRLCAYDQLWNYVTRQARSLAYDGSGRLVLRSLPKFFNLSEPQGEMEAPKDEKYEVHEKLDGSRIQIVKDPKYDLIVSSKCSFASQHAQWAQELIKDESVFEGGYTHVFELIHPNNRIVVDYGEDKKLVHLTSIENSTGKEFDFDLGYEKPKKYSEDELTGVLEEDNTEGVVLLYESGYRVKIKTDEYVKMHRIVTGYSHNTIWEKLSTGEQIDLKDVPEEFVDWVDSVSDEYTEIYTGIMKEVGDKCRELSSKKSHKQIAKELASFKYAGLVFATLNGKSIEDRVWRLTKQEYKRRKAVDNSEKES